MSDRGTTRSAEPLGLALLTLNVEKSNSFYQKSEEPNAGMQMSWHPAWNASQLLRLK